MLFIMTVLLTKMLQNVCTFCKFDKCCTNNSWKDHWQGFLKPLPVSKQIWQKIFIDFVVDLLSSEGCMNLLIITDCLNKKIILKLCKNMTAEWVTQTFVQHFYWAHELFTAIVSDWDTQFVSSLWRVCQLWRLYKECSQHITQKLTEQLSEWIRMLSCTFVFLQL
jgi:hypothetical protein